MKRIFLALAAAALPLIASADSESYTTVGQPTVFWRFGEWQTMQNGKWVPYVSAPKTTAREPEVANEPESALPPETSLSETNVYLPGYGWGYGIASREHRRSERERRVIHAKTEHRKPSDGIARPTGGLGQTTIGIGKQNGGIGRTTIGIGQNNTGIGQTTIGIGRQSSGIGQPTIGIGQPMGFSRGSSGSRESFGGGFR